MCDFCHTRNMGMMNDLWTSSMWAFRQHCLVVSGGRGFLEAHRSNIDLSLTNLFLLCFYTGHNWKSLLVYKYLLSIYYILGPKDTLRMLQTHMKVFLLEFLYLPLRFPTFNLSFSHVYFAASVSYPKHI